MNKENKNDLIHLKILNQYIKDLSFENLQNPRTKKETIKDNISVDLDAFFQSFSKNIIGVSLKIKCSAKHENKNLFLIELDYFGLFEIIKGHDVSKERLTNEAVKFLFPFARFIVANTTQNGGDLPIFLDNIDFNLTKKLES